MCVTTTAPALFVAPAPSYAHSFIPTVSTAPADAPRNPTRQRHAHLPFVKRPSTRRLHQLHRRRAVVCSAGDRRAEFQSSSSSSSSSSPSSSSIDWDKWAAASSSSSSTSSSSVAADATSTTSSASSSSPSPSPVNTAERFAALPFSPDEVFLPGESKQLHLFEARYLSLFESCISQYDNRCGHILVDAPRRAMAAVGTLLEIREWERLTVGVRLVVDGVGRLHTKKLYPSQPFLTADFSFVTDDVASEVAKHVPELRRLYRQFWPLVHTLWSYTTQLQSPDDEPLLRAKHDPARRTIRAVQQATNQVLEQTQQQQQDSASDMDLETQQKIDSIRQSLQNDDDKKSVLSNSSNSSSDSVALLHSTGLDLTFAQLQDVIKEKAQKAVGCSMRLDWSHCESATDPESESESESESELVSDEMVVYRAMGVSFAAWELFASNAQQRQKALEQRSTSARLRTVIELMEQREKHLAAKLAVKSALSSK